MQDKDNSVIEKPSEDQNGNDSAKDVEELRSVEHQEPASETTVDWLVENSLFQLEIVFPFKLISIFSRNLAQDLVANV